MTHDYSQLFIAGLFMDFAHLITLLVITALLSCIHDLLKMLKEKP